ncbi:uncharacterized protein BCR38DRAFT_336968 [Pseudomassariella vexata]|uniref:Uncharacterized protein n=1 Tax=Pseudomassariella vexata TaxID=1141098 RepID=A0A1Y2E633_9PEZI|nr:uncharacterized protein BCR38DRAFT_336968 [Pseudomassariella vexata]ORY66982.1 hypothetical protein BCR38DRAFT_336968 [Pseudomassariella vexata]
MSTLLGLLERAAQNAANKRLFFYDEHDSKSSITYSSLLIKARENANILRSSGTIIEGQVVLLHLECHADYLIWFWSVLVAKAVPAVSTPLPIDRVACEHHLQHLANLLRNPLVLTTESLAHQLSAASGFKLVLVESLRPVQELAFKGGSEAVREPVSNGPDLAFLMLTSGSTGNAKAVELRHSQVISAVTGKARLNVTSETDVFLNWIGFDHVACVTEMHIHAMAVCASQVHVAAKLVLQDPLSWLEIMAAHSVTYSFAPNFFLASVCKALEARTATPRIDLSRLRIIVSGGEANTVSTGVSFNQLLRSMGAADHVLQPAFGMSETCAGSIYNKDFPNLERRSNMEDFCSVGREIHTMKMRITDSDGSMCSNGQQGNLELKGPALFSGYYNDAKNTSTAFTADGWFKTGDTGYFTQGGNLVLCGRTKDSIIINGVKYFSHELESAIEEAAEDLIVHSYTTAFSTWPKGSDGEEVVVTFVGSDRITDDDDDVLASAFNRIITATLLYCSKTPLHIVPIPAERLQKSSLGKVSRSGLKTAYEAGKLDESGRSSASPIWFIHPGLGEVLVFLNISKYFSDRQVYALRAPGFNPGEKVFESIDEMTTIYMHAIQRKQPSGPYVLIGYSFGSMIAFEIAKKLEAAGNEVGFVGSLNGPPHIAWRLQQIDWGELLLNLIYFLGFITEEEAHERTAESKKYKREEALSKVMKMAPPAKLKELDLTQTKLARWADISSALQGLAHDYRPVGSVACIDVFYAHPLVAVGRDKEAWREKHLSPWQDFSRGEVRFHNSPGAHYTMLGPEQAFDMHKILRSAIRARGVI